VGLSVPATTVFAPLLGNFQLAPGQPGAGTARLLPGISDSLAGLLGLNGRSSVDFTILETQSPAAAGLAAALSGFYARVQAVRESAAQVSRVIGEGIQANRLDADQTVAAAASLVAAINDLRQFVQQNPDSFAAGLLLQIDSPVSRLELRDQLANIGITIDAEGTLALSEGALRDALGGQPQLVERTLALVGGLATNELEMATSLLRGATAAVLGFSGPTLTAPTGSSAGAASFLLTTATIDQARFIGQFVNLLV